MAINLENKELIEEYEKLGVMLNKTLIELILRYENGELTDLEWNHVTDISSRRGAELIDYLNVDKKDIKEGISQAVDIIADENR